MYSPTQVQRIRRRWCSTLYRDVAFSGPEADLVSAALGLQPFIGAEARRPPISSAPRMWWTTSMRVLGGRMNKDVQRREITLKEFEVT